MSLTPSFTWSWCQTLCRVSLMWYLFRCFIKQSVLYFLPHRYMVTRFTIPHISNTIQRCHFLLSLICLPSWSNQRTISVLQMHMTSSTWKVCDVSIPVPCRRTDIHIRCHWMSRTLLPYELWLHITIVTVILMHHTDQDEELCDLELGIWYRTGIGKNSKDWPGYPALMKQRTCPWLLHHPDGTAKVSIATKTPWRNRYGVHCNTTLTEQPMYSWQHRRYGSANVSMATGPWRNSQVSIALNTALTNSEGSHGNTVLTEQRRYPWKHRPGGTAKVCLQQHRPDGLMWPEAKRYPGGRGLSL